jgi:hypothetical protein
MRPPDSDVHDAAALARTVQLHVLRWFARHGLLDASAVADMRSWRGTGGFASHLRCSVSSTAVDGSVRIEAEDRAGLERLVRHCARGPLALERLHAPAGIGTLTSPDARLRSAVVSIGRPADDEPPAHAEPPPSPRPASPSVAPPGPSREPAPTGTPAATPRSRSSRMPSRMLWAQLLARIYEVLPLLCPACGGEMRIISCITLPSTVQRILLHLDLPPRPAPSASPRLPRSRPSPGRTPLRPVPGLRSRRSRRSPGVRVRSVLTRRLGVLNLLPADSLPFRCSHRGVRHRPFQHPPGPDSHRPSSTSPPPALRRFPPSRQAPPSSTRRALAQPETGSGRNRALPCLRLQQGG